MKIIGYCPTCHVGVADPELQCCCTRCGRFLVRKDLDSSPPVPAAVQAGRDLFKRNFKPQIKGIKNGGTTVKAPRGTKHQELSTKH